MSELVVARDHERLQDWMKQSLGRRDENACARAFEVASLLRPDMGHLSPGTYNM
jgi:hypothetical protein